MNAKKTLTNQAVALLLSSLPWVANAQQGDLGTVEIITTSPLPGATIPIDQAPFSVKQVDNLSEDSPRQSLSDSLFKGISGVQKTDNQGNPYQSDVTYRGFSVTPLLGTPPGISAYVDGVRQNETFGDVVRFDAIPQSALKSVSILPGTMPQFGLNSLGGALVMTTKNGRDINGNILELEAGSFGRKRLGFEKGWVDDKTQNDYYFNFNAFDEDGWRDRSPSQVYQLFGKMGIVRGSTITTVSLSAYDSDLNGNGVVPRDIYRFDSEQSFTYVDNTQNTGAQLAVNFEKFLDNGGEYAANAYFRTSRSKTFNGDGNENEDYRYNVVAWEPNGNAPADRNCDLGADGVGDGPQFDANGNPIANSAGFDGSNLESDCPAANNRGVLDQNLIGLSAQYTFPAMGKHRLAFGAQAELGKSDFRRTYALGVFTAQRDVRETVPQIEQVNVEADNRQVGVYAQDVIALSEKTTLMLAGRFNHANVKTVDRLAVPLIGGADPANTQTSPGLNNDYTYNRFNPSIGLSFTPASNTTWYASAGTSNRVPTPVELACSDPLFPCLLPNAMAADPFLEQVVTTTVEGGYRTAWASQGFNYGFSANAFHARNKDDIIFVTNGAGSGGFFQNYGRTQRQGVELDFSLANSRWEFSASYQYLDATFETAALLASEGNSTAVDANGNRAVEGGFIRVRPGDKIPGISEHNLKLSLAFKPVASTTLFADVQAQSDQYARGNENNAHVPGTFTVNGDDFTFDDDGKVSGFAVLNLGANYEASKSLTFIARVNNVLDKDYANGGVLGGNIFDPATGFTSLVDQEDDVRFQTFVAPGAPRNAWLGLRYRF